MEFTLSLTSRSLAKRIEDPISAVEKLRKKENVPKKEMQDLL